MKHEDRTVPRLRERELVKATKRSTRHHTMAIIGWVSLAAVLAIIAALLWQHTRRVAGQVGLTGFTPVTAQPNDPVVQLVTARLTRYQREVAAHPATTKRAGVAQFLDLMQGMTAELVPHHLYTTIEAAGPEDVTVDVSALHDALLQRGFYFKAYQAGLTQTGPGWVVPIWLARVTASRSASLTTTSGESLAYRHYLAEQPIGAWTSPTQGNVCAIALADDRVIVQFPGAANREIAALRRSRLMHPNPKYLMNTRVMDGFCLRQWGNGVAALPSELLTRQLSEKVVTHELQHLADAEAVTLTMTDRKLSAMCRLELQAVLELRAELHAIADGPLPFMAMANLMVSWPRPNMPGQYQLAATLPREPLLTDAELATISEQTLRDRARDFLGRSDSTYWFLLRAARAHVPDPFELMTKNRGR